MKFVYEPSGRAREYCPWALNIYSACCHGCLYCYVPQVLHRAPVDFHRDGLPRVGIVDGVRADLQEMKAQGIAGPVLLCFACDPYGVEDTTTTRTILEMFAAAGVSVRILTKNGAAAQRDFDLLKANPGSSFGVSLVWVNDNKRQVWEPGAGCVEDRMLALIEAKKQGIPTWVSIEPVVDPAEALLVVKVMQRYVDEWKVGLLNYWKDGDGKPAAPGFLRKGFVHRMDALLKTTGARYYLKKDMLKYW